jgi:O-antigen ligase
MLSLIFNVLGSNFIEGRLLNEELNINEVVLVNLALMSTIIINSLKFNRKTSITIIMLILPVLFSIFSGSRMSVGATVILLIGFLISSFKNINWKTLLSVSIISLVFFFITKDLLSKTVVFERLKSTTSQSEELSVDESKGTIFEYFGDRGSFYVEGIKIFSENPFLGIGLLNYAQTHEKVCHVEYIIYLAELGILGFLLYLLFLKSIYNRIMIKIRDNKNIKTSKFLLFVYFSIIFCGFVLFLYNSFAIAYLFGLLLLLTKKEKTKKILL